MSARSFSDLAQISARSGSLTAGHLASPIVWSTGFSTACATLHSGAVPAIIAPPGSSGPHQPDELSTA
jgi:hypothetical protein